MRFKIIIFCASLLFTIVCNAQVISVKRGPRQTVNLDTVSYNSFYKGKLYIKFKPGFDVLLKQNTDKIVTGNYSFGIKELDDAMQLLGVNNLKRSFEQVLETSSGDAKHTAWELNRWCTINLPQNADIKAAIKKFKALTNIIETAEPAYIRHLHDGTEPVIPWTPTDSIYNLQWHFNHTAQQGPTTPVGTDADIDLPEAWALEKGKPNVIVAVLDGGVDTTHPDLRQNLWIGSAGERFGYNWNNKNQLLEPNNHGTHVCGTIAAVNNNGIGVSGIAGGDGTAASGARIMSMQIFDDSGHYAGDDATASAFVYAADHGASIAQCSWGGGSATSILTDAIDYFIMNGGGSVLNGGLAVFSAGNDYTEVESFPSNYPPVICVAATDYDDKIPAYSNYGPWVDISAPGGQTSSSIAKGVLSTVPISTGSYYGWNRGTSMACPHVSGVAALCVSKAPGKLGNEQLRNILLNGVDDIYPLNPLYVGKLGSGRINAFLAVQNAALVDSTLVNPANNFSAVQSCGQAVFTWTKNSNNDNVIIAEADTLLFGTPVTVLNVGAQINGGGTVVYKGNSSSFSKLLPINKNKYYRIWSFNGTNYSAHKTISIIYNVFTSGLTLSNNASCNVGLIWSDATDCITDSVLITAHKRNTSTAPSGFLNVGDTIVGGATIIYKGRANSFNYNSGFDSVVYFQKWNFNSAYEYTNPYINQIDTVIKPNAIQYLSATNTNATNIQLNWQPVNNANCFNGNNYILLYSTTSDFGTPAGTYLVGDSLPNGGKVIYIGNGNAFTHTNLTANTRYCYKIFSIKNGAEYSTGKQLCTNTICDNSTIILPFADGFNGDDNSLPNVCLWDIENNTGNASAITIKRSSGAPNLVPIEGNAALRFNAYNIQDMSARLTSRFIKKGVGNSMDVLFRWYQDSSNYTIPIFGGEGVLVQWSDDRSHWKNLEFYPRVPVQGDTGWAFKQITLPTAAIAKDTVYLSFLFTSAYGNNCYLDDLKLKVSNYKPSNGITSGAACESTDSTTGWTNYYDTTGYRLLSIKKNAINIGKAGQKGFELKLGGNLQSSAIPITGSNYVSNVDGWLCMNRYYTVKPISEPNAKVSIRFYYSTADFDSLSAKAATLYPPRTNITHADLYGYKINEINTNYIIAPSLGQPSIPLATAYNKNGFAQYKNAAMADTSTWQHTSLGNNMHSMEYVVGHLGGGGLGIGSFYGLGALQRVTYTFTGNGNWSNSANWQNQNVPPLILPADAVIIINPISAGECLLDVTQQVLNGGAVIINQGKIFKVKGNLTITK